MTCATCSPVSRPDPWLWRVYWHVYARVFGFCAGLVAGVKLGQKNRVENLGLTRKQMTDRIGDEVGTKFLVKYFMWKAKR